MKDITSRTNIKEEQHVLNGGENIKILEWKNIEQKRKIKEEVKKRFDGEMFRSIITPREIDNNIRFNKLERLDRTKQTSDIKATIERADNFGKKSLKTLSTFPSTLTFVYTQLLNKEGDKVYDAFMGHNSRPEDILTLNRKYYAYDVHTFQINIGFASKEVINANINQVANLPKDLDYLVMSVGSGINFISVLKGLSKFKIKVGRIIGICTGKDPKSNLNAYYPEKLIKYDLIKYPTPYSNRINFGDFDEIYEAKAYKWLIDEINKGFINNKAKILFWVIGKRNLTLSTKKIIYMEVKK